MRATRNGEKQQYLKFLFLIRPFQRQTHKRSSHGGIIQRLSGLRRTGSDPFVIAHSLNNTHPDNKAASMPQRFSSRPALLQVQSAALPSQYSLSLPLQMGFAPAPYKRYKESQRVWHVLVDENGQVQMKLYIYYHIILVSS